jgi:hypothetical protein
MDEAFTLIRTFARNHNRGLSEVAASLVSGSLDIAQVHHTHK